MNSIALPQSCPQDVLESGYVVLLKQTGLLSAEGDDAVRFVHGQLSNDIEHLGPGSVRVAAYCTPQGRMLALFHIWKSGGKVCMMLPRDILPALQKRLQIYVLRAKVKLADESDSMAILGIGGREAETVLSEWFPGLPLALSGKTENETGVLMRVKDAFGAPRYLLAVPSGKLQEMESALSAKLAVCDESGWLLGDIEAGTPQITLPVQDRFIPQMVNLEETGGLSFKKGCYPGQEVIARSQYRGTVKRRMFHGQVKWPEGTAVSALNMAAGADLFDSQGLVCGTVVQSVRRDGKYIDCLAVVQTDAKETGDIHAETPDGPVLTWVPLPYSLTGTGS